MVTTCHAFRRHPGYDRRTCHEEADALSYIILGGNGFLGTNLVLHLLREGELPVIVVDPEPPRGPAQGAVKDGRLTWIARRISDRWLDEVAIRGNDVVFNLAAQTSHTRSMQAPLRDLELNVQEQLLFLEALRENANAPPLVVYTSTSSVVGATDGRIADETTAEDPADIYSAHKGLVEKYHRIYHRAFGVPTIGLRFANLYGPYGNAGSEFGVLNHFIDLASRDATIRLFGGGTQDRNAMFVNDAVRALLAAPHARGLLGQTAFAVHRDHHPLRHIAERIIAGFGQGRIVSVPWPQERKVIEAGSVRLTAQRFMAATGWMPMLSLDEGIAATRRETEQIVP